jgi:hypothetical protein
LCNRRPKEWHDTSRVEVGGLDGEPPIDTRELPAP